MTNSTIRRVIVLGAFAILSLISIQTYWVLRTWDLQEREFNRKVFQALLDVSHSLAELGNFVLPNENMIDQLYSNYYTVNIENPFDAPTLEWYLKRSLENQGLYEDFQYGIFDCSSKELVTGGYVDYDENSVLGQSFHTTEEPLPAHYDSKFIYYFGVRFPHKSANLLSNMWIVVAFTVLMLLTIGFFIYAMFVILRQKQLSELQRDFINNMTHEFKTPISTINISTDVFLQNDTIKTNPRLDRYAGIIKQQVLRLNTQVEKVLQLAKIERDTIELNFETVDLGQLIRHLSPSLELKIQEKQGELHLELPADPVFIRADRLHLTNIVHNLVDNAVKYTRTAPQIRIAVQPGPRHSVVLTVQDNGIGIAREHQKRVFDKFYRVPTGNVHNVKGFGLGLFYVKTMCREHHWRLELQSEPGKGTSMLIYMPQVKENATAGKTQDAKASPAEV
jgi:two-component system phosphate regulon sensor histidine kinase PhoR